MKILLTGASGYIGKRLLPALVDKGHHVVCAVRDIVRFNPPSYLRTHISVIQIDFLDSDSLAKIPNDIDGAFYLIHSMSASSQFSELEQKCAINFRKRLNNTEVQHVIYLSGMTNSIKLSEHLQSRSNVEKELSQGDFSLTTLRAGIIIGSGSASFEIIRDLVEKLPIMVTPKWLDIKCQPIGIADVITILCKSIMYRPIYDEDFDIGGPDILSYKEMLLGLANVRKLKRRIYILPIMTPRLSSYWLYFVTSTSYKLASALVNSMKIEVVCRDNRLLSMLNIIPITYKESLKRAFLSIESNDVLSSWKDAYISSNFNMTVSDFVNVPQDGCFVDSRKHKVSTERKTRNKIWRIGGSNGWYYANYLWRIRGFLDKLAGGVGLDRKRTSDTEINAGDVLDFWRVLYANKKEGRLLLLAEMKLPGDAWLEFRIIGGYLYQTATFRPLGLRGRFYWYLVFPLHTIIFRGLIMKLSE